MKIDIDRFGLKNVQVDPDTLFSFPQGLAGFNEQKHFKLFHEEGGKAVFWLQSLDDAEVSFPVVTPDALDIAYEIELSDDDCRLIGLEDVGDAAVLVIVYRESAEDGGAPNGRIAANTRSPVILNLKTRLGMQKILHEIHPSLLYRAR